MYILWIVFIIAAIVGWYFFQKDNQKISIALKKQALQRSGTVKKVFASYPQLSFYHKEVSILVSAIHGENGPFTSASFHTTIFPDYCNFRIISRSRPTIVMETRLELKKVKTGQPEFDSKFIIRAKEKEFIRSLLTPKIQSELLELGAKHGLEVRFLSKKLSNAKNSIKKFRFGIFIEHLLTENQDYERLIETAIMFYEQMEKLQAK